MTGLRYSFDTSSLLNGRRDLLPPEVFPTLWAKIEQSISDGVIRAVDVVRDELGKRDDATMAWSAAQSGLFLAFDADIQRSTSNTLVACRRIMGRSGGRNAADPFVIGLARARDCTVVIEETPSGRLDRPRIPDVCGTLSICCVNLVGSSGIRAGRSDTARSPVVRRMVADHAAVVSG